MEAKNVRARYFSVSILFFCLSIFLSEFEESQRMTQVYLVQGPQHFVEEERFDARETASLVASRHCAKSLSSSPIYLNAEIAD